MEAEDLKPASDGGTAPAKRPKTGGRVNKPLDQLLAEARVRDELAGMREDSTLPKKLAAIEISEVAAETLARRASVD